MVITNRRGYPIAEEEYGILKNLLLNGVSHQQMHEMTGRSKSTMSRIRNSENFEEFQRESNEKVALLQNRTKKPVALPSADETVATIAQHSLPQFISVYKSIRAATMDELAATLNSLQSESWNIHVIKTSLVKRRYECLVKIVREI